MPISIRCPGCGKDGILPDAMAGKSVRCPRCRHKLAIPEPGSIRTERPVPPPIVQARVKTTDLGFVSEQARHSEETPPRKTVDIANGLGVGATILGIVAIPLSIIPCLSFAGLPLAIVGLLLGIGGLVVSFTSERRAIGITVAGSAVSLCAAGLSTLWMVIGFSIMNMPKKESQQPIAVGSSVDARDEKQIGKDEQSLDRAVDASGPGASLDDIHVQVVSVVYGFVPIEERGRDSKSVKPYLMIEVKITNKSDTKKMIYSTWGADQSAVLERSTDRGTLADEFGNTYRRIHFGLFAKVVGGNQIVEIHPGKSESDIIVFDKPVLRATSFTLRLPVGAIDVRRKGEFLFRIPKSMIRFDEKLD